MTVIDKHHYDAILAEACQQAGISHVEAELLRVGENALYRLPGGHVARIARPGQQAAAAKEVRVARWMADHDIPAIHPLLDVPVVVGDRAVTFWQELPPHRRGRYPEVAVALRRLHAVEPPDWIPPLVPFVRTAARIDHATTLTKDDRLWLHERRAELERRWAELPPGLPHAVIHGDAYGGNIVVTADGTVTMLDLERVSVGPPEWDLTSTAVHLGFEWIDRTDYDEYCRAYGSDVTNWAGYELLRDIRELRITTWMAQLAVNQPDRYKDEAALRVASLRGWNGPRPWAWTAG
jgi:Ser/Thr protein kinase RdoA (MazF antagonist)